MSYENCWNFIKRVPNKHNNRYSLYKCICGKEKEVNMRDVELGKSRSCGCKKSEQQIIHNARSDPLYNTWNGIIQRCYNKRDVRFPSYGAKGVEMLPEWRQDFHKFKAWCLTNGWRKGLHLCRKGDKGNYEPSNLRIDTPQSNTEEACAKSYKFKNPSGELITLYNLTKFCRENKLDPSNMVRVSKGKQGAHKGWTKGD